MKADSLLAGLPASYWIDLNVNNQVAAAKKIAKQRIYIAQGDNDYQVNIADFNLWKSALGTKKNVTLKLYPEMNHMLSLQTEKSSPEQYQVHASVAEILVTDIANWVKAK